MRCQGTHTVYCPQSSPSLGLLSSRGMLATGRGGRNVSHCRNTGAIPMWLCRATVILQHCLERRWRGTGNLAIMCKYSLRVYTSPERTKYSWKIEKSSQKKAFKGQISIAQICLWTARQVWIFYTIFSKQQCISDIDQYWPLYIKTHNLAFWWKLETENNPSNSNQPCKNTDIHSLTDIFPYIHASDVVSLHKLAKSLEILFRTFLNNKTSEILGGKHPPAKPEPIVYILYLYIHTLFSQ